MPESLVCVIESHHPAPLGLQQGLAALGDFRIVTLEQIPTDVDEFEVLVLNNLPVGFQGFQEDRVLHAFDRGKGVFCIHDSVFPDRGQHRLLDIAGIRRAYDTIVETGEGADRVRTMMLARADLRDPLQRFPLRPTTARHSRNQTIMAFPIS